MARDVFQDRAEAGRELASRLCGYEGRPGVLVLALPRGGVPVAYEVARVLGATLDVFPVRKLGVPGQPELAFGAVSAGGVRLLNPDVVDGLGITPEEVERVAAEEGEELARRIRMYRGDRPAPELRGRTVILVDDGLATGASMRAAVAAARCGGPARLAAAVPVAARSTCKGLRGEVDELVCAWTPEPFRAVGHWYRDFSQMTDAEVEGLLRKAEGAGAPVDAARPAGRRWTDSGRGACSDE